MNGLGDGLGDGDEPCAELIPVGEGHRPVGRRLPERGVRELSLGPRGLGTERQPRRREALGFERHRADQMHVG